MFHIKSKDPLDVVIIKNLRIKEPTYKKECPEYLKYMYVGERDILIVIIASKLIVIW